VSGWFPRSRPARSLVIATAILVVGGFTLLAVGGDNGESADTSDDRSASATVVEESSPGTSALSTGATSASGSSTDDQTSTETAGSVDVTTTEAPQPVLPTNPISQSDEASTCRGIVERLIEYRELAVNEPITSLLTLQLGLDEFEGDVDFLSEGHEWGVVILEELVVVRRDWSTAYSAHFANDQEVVTARTASAIERLDAAINAPCP
jgi:hypothetical protein